MAIDKIVWHWDSVTDSSSEEERLEKAGVHIGYFMEWAYKKGFAPNNPETHDVDEYLKVVNSEKNGLQFLIENCDSKFWDVDLNEQGLKFTTFAYTNYLDSYVTIVKHEPYTEKYNLQDRENVFKYLDEVYADYLKKPSKVEKQNLFRKYFGRKNK